MAAEMTGFFSRWFSREFEPATFSTIVKRLNHSSVTSLYIHGYLLQKDKYTPNTFSVFRLKHT